MSPAPEKGTLVTAPPSGQGAPAAGPKDVPPGSREAYLSLLLHMEQRARDAASPQELGLIIVNDTRKVTAAQQIFLTGMTEGSARVRAVSDVTAPDRNAPFIQWVERIVNRMAKDDGPGRPHVFSLPAYCDSGDEEARTYPFRHFLWAPLKGRDGTVFAGMLQARDSVWRENDAAAAMHLAGVYQHAWQALLARGAIRPRRSKRRWFRAAAVAVIAAVTVWELYS